MKIKPILGSLGLAALLGLGSQAWADVAAVKASLEKLLPGVDLGTVEAAPVAGLYEVVVGPRIFYVSADGRYLIQGKVIDTQTRRNITDEKLAKAKKAAVEKVGEENMVVFPAKDEKHTITVFTDIDCGYCRKLHNEMEAYNDAGISVRYLFYPRSGVDSPSYDKAVSVWCADDRNEAMTKAKNGQSLDSKKCDNPVQDHMFLGELMGVNGTPAIVLEDGNLLPGYVPAKRMAMYLKGKASK